MRTTTTSKSRKLSLSRETVRKLTAEELAHVAGARKDSAADGGTSCRSCNWSACASYCSSCPGYAC
jgi:hypothetical protein